MMMMNSEVSSAARNKKLEDDEEEVEVEEEEEELELGLSLGAKKINGNSSNKYCRILTAKDFPAVIGSRASPMPSSSSSSVSSSATLGNGGGGGGNKTQNQNPPSQVVVGWPPIRAFRMNSLVSHSKENASDSEIGGQKKSGEEETRIKNHAKKRGNVGNSQFVKVNMDGDAIGRKVDLNAHVSYQTLALALETMFHKPTIGLSTSAYNMKASKLLDGSSEFALTYEDKDGDWMLVGDVPWGMFLDTVKRLRIMRTSDASGLAPRFQPTTRVS